MLSAFIFFAVVVGYAGLAEPLRAESFVAPSSGNLYLPVPELKMLQILRTANGGLKLSLTSLR